MSSRIISVCVATAALLTVAGSADAQTCGGSASFESGRARIDGIASFSDDISGIGAALSVGVPRGAFVTGSVSRMSLDLGLAGDETAPMFGVTGGYAIDIGSPARPSAVQVCPLLGFQYLAGPSIDLGPDGSVDAHSRSLLAGFSIGGEIASTPTLSLVPTAGFAYVAETVTVEATGLARETTDENYGSLSAGLGMVFNRRVTLGFAAAIPVGVDGASSSFGLAFGVIF